MLPPKDEQLGLYYVRRVCLNTASRVPLKSFYLEQTL